MWGISWLDEELLASQDARYSMVLDNRLFSSYIVFSVVYIIQVGAKRTHVFEMGYLPAISFFGVISNQKSTMENLVQSTI
jgi:hypothetical protein